MSRLYDTTLHCDLLFRVFYVNIFFDVCYQKGNCYSKALFMAANLSIGNVLMKCTFPLITVINGDNQRYVKTKDRFRGQNSPRRCSTILWNGRPDQWRRNDIWNWTAYETTLDGPRSAKVLCTIKRIPTKRFGSILLERIGQNFITKLCTNTKRKTAHKIENIFNVLNCNFTLRMSYAPESRPRVSLKPNSHTKAYISKCLTSVVKGPRERSGFTALKASRQSFSAWPLAAMI